ncbi:MAG: hypothetical protein AAF555_00035 [Verrucomicrobiota bacterium]
MRVLPWALSLFASLLLGLGVGYWLGRESRAEPSPVDRPHPSIQFRDPSRLPFPTLIQESAGKEVRPLQPSRAADREILATVSQLVEEAASLFSQEDSPLRSLSRINEASRYFEDFLQRRLDELEDYSCVFPANAAGKTQRSGYPDLKLIHQPSGQVAYIDPKLYALGSEESSFRTFYYQPSHTTGKLHHHAHHLLIGIGHDGKDGQWTFLDWKIVDLYHLTLQRKTEYNASNRELYQASAILAERP